MRKYVTVSCAITAMIFPLLSAPVARADDANFLVAVRDVGFQQTPINLISTAQSVCYAFLIGDRLRADPTRDNPPDRVESRVERSLLVSPYQAHEFVVISAREYCPQYSDRLGE